jgi:hypothetical protein
MPWGAITEALCWSQRNQTCQRGGSLERVRQVAPRTKLDQVRSRTAETADTKKASAGDLAGEG